MSMSGTGPGQVKVSRESPGWLLPGELLHLFTLVCCYLGACLLPVSVHIKHKPTSGPLHMQFLCLTASSPTYLHGSLIVTFKS